MNCMYLWNRDSILYLTLKFYITNSIQKVMKVECINEKLTNVIDCAGDANDGIKNNY